MLNIHMNMDMKMNMNINMNINIDMNVDININIHIIMNTNVHIHINNTTLAATLRVLTCSRTLSAAVSRDSECGCNLSSSGFKINNTTLPTIHHFY